MKFILSSYPVENQLNTLWYVSIVMKKLTHYQEINTLNVKIAEISQLLPKHIIHALNSFQNFLNLFLTFSYGSHKNTVVNQTNNPPTHICCKENP